MERKNITITAVVIAAVIAVGALIGVSIAQGSPDHSGSSSDPNSTSSSDPDSTTESAIAAVNYAKDGYKRARIKGIADEIDTSKFTPYKIYSAIPEDGNIADNVKGDPTKAQIVLYEFADFQCTHCAEWNTIVNNLLEASDGTLALVYRSYALSYNTSSVMVSSAVLAASLQGYWSEYKDLIFANQAEWYYMKPEALQGQLEKYFLTVTKTKGDLDKFRSDMRSDAVAQKLGFDMALATAADLQGTPSFYIDGEKIPIADLITTLQDRLK